MKRRGRIRLVAGQGLILIGLILLGVALLRPRLAATALEARIDGAREAVAALRATVDEHRTRAGLWPADTTLVAAGVRLGTGTIRHVWEPPLSAPAADTLLPPAPRILTLGVIRVHSSEHRLLAALQDAHGSMSFVRDTTWTLVMGPPLVEVSPRDTLPTGFVPPSARETGDVEIRPPGGPIGEGPVGGAARDGRQR